MSQKMLIFITYLSIISMISVIGSQ